MNIWLIIISVFFGLIFIVLIAWLILLLTKTKAEETDDTIILNFMPNFCVPNPSAIGTCISTKKINNRFLKEIEVKDVNVKTVNEGKKVENVKLAVDNNHIISFPKGTLSSNRNIEIILPPNPEDFPKELKDHPFGKVLMQYVSDINAENTVVEVLQSKGRVQDKLLKKTEGGDRMEEYIELDADMNKQIAQKATEKEKGPEKKSPFTQPSGFNQ